MKRGKRGQAKRSSPKRSLNLPDLDQAKSAVLNSLPSKVAQRGYRHSIDEFTAWYCSEPRLSSCNKAVVARYRIHLESRQLAPGTINGRLAAVRRLAYEAADSGLLRPDLAAGIRRVKGTKNLGIRLGSWLTAARQERSGRCPARIRSRVSEIERWPGSCWVAGCAGRKRQNWTLPIFNGGKTTGPSSIWSARPGTFGRRRFRIGSRAPSIRGSPRLA